jgi:asparagine synthase (glutamine-hydrolysing)
VCGIAGIYWSKPGPASDAKIVGRMMCAIEHRGPDSEGRFSTEFADVGFRRLSIIDLAGGDQPISNEDGSVQCFLNGEIYNYLELRKDLLALGHTFRTASDTEVLPHMYEEYGTEMFRMLNGMFAICLIDLKKQQLLLARDPFGVKQLYYAGTPQGTVFASEVKAILASGLVKPEVDESSVLPYLTLFYCPEPYTLVKGIRKISPGSWTRLGAEKPIEHERYYEVSTTPQQLDMDLNEAAEQTRRLLWRSVELQLQADVPVGISLSGGIDSSAIACAAVRRQSPGPVPIALTIHWPDTSPEEMASAKELCEHLGMAHEILEIPIGNLLDELPLLAWISDEPVADPATYSQFCISRVAARFVKVLLGGAGGDELFGGYGSYRLSKKYTAYEALPRPIQKGLRPILSGKWMDEDSLDAMMEYRDSRFLWHSRTKSNLTIQEQTLLSDCMPGSRDPFVNFQSLFHRYKKHDPVNQQMIVDFQTYLPEQILTMMDRATMAASIEGRVPFLDGPLVDYAFSLSAKTKMGIPADGKRVLKQAISKDVSKSILIRKKLGMPSPFMSFLTGHIEAIRQIILSADSYVRSILPEEWLKSMTSNEVAARANFRVLYAILTLEMWHKLFIRNQTYERPDVNCLDLFEIPSRTLSA